MTYEEFNAFCGALAATTHVVQWGGSHVWKVGGKVFAIASGYIASGQEGKPSITFKVSDIAYEMLKDRPGLRPAPYLASRGMKWIQHFARPGLSTAALRDYIGQSHALVSQGLSKKRRIELGLGHGGRGMAKKTVTIFGIKNCDTMKKARNWLGEHGVAYTFHDYKAEGIDSGTLQRWAREVGWQTLLNRAGTTFRKLPQAEKEGIGERKALALMASEPSMIKRPVLQVAGKLIVGFDPTIYAAALL